MPCESQSPHIATHMAHDNIEYGGRMHENKSYR